MTIRKTLRISFALRNTYRVNSILYSLKQIPLVKKILPSSLYSARGLKIFANVLSAFWELISVFVGKALYILVMLLAFGSLYPQGITPALFLHVFLFLTVIGAYANTSLFTPTRDKYYAMILMRMDARAYTLVNYAYAMLKVVVGFLPFTIWLGKEAGLPLWACILLPFGIAGMKLTYSAYSLRRFENAGQIHNENKLNKYKWLAMVLLLAAAYGLPAYMVVLPEAVSISLFALSALLGLVSMRRIAHFSQYRAANQVLLAGLFTQMDVAAQAAKKASQRAITADTTIVSRRSGFEFLNELFVKRHRKILWRSAKRVAGVSALVFVGLYVAMFCFQDKCQGMNALLMNFLPYFTFIMYAINRGTGFTQALFMNCDNSLLTYSFYKKPAFVLKLFQIRLRELMKINLLPALVIGGGLAGLLFVTGGTDNPLNYVVLFGSIVCMSLFFSVHYLTIYYLLQPYNAGTELKSGMYKIIMMATYMVCYVLMQVRLPIMLFGVLAIVFCLVYCVVACILVYKLAPKTFKIRN